MKYTNMSSYIERNRGYITNSKLKLYMQSKEAYKKVYVDEVDTSFVPESPALIHGDMVDKYVLSRHLFDQEYVIPNWSLKADLERECLARGIPTQSKETVQSLKDKLYGNKTVLNDTQSSMTQGIYKELSRQPLYDMEWEYEHQKELIVEYKGMKLKATLDRLWKQVRDLKTSRDLEYNQYYDTTKIENKLCQNDEYEYWMQLAWYVMIVYIHTWEWKDWILDIVKSSWNYAYEAYYYSADTLKTIVHSRIFPILDTLIEDTNNNTFIDNTEDRGKILNNRYYPILECWIQKEFREIVPIF